MKISEQKICKRCGKEFKAEGYPLQIDKFKFCSKPCQYKYHSTEKFKRKRKEDPEWNAKRQREWRKKYPDNFNMTMARCYLRKLNKKQRQEVLKSIKR